jgi:dipeptidyl-peptidase-4
MKNALLFFVLYIGFVQAQTQISIEDAVLKGRNKLSPARLQALKAIKNNDNFSFVANGKLVKINAKTAAIDTLKLLNTIIDKNIAKEQLNWYDAEQLYVQSDSQIFVFNWQNPTEMVMKYNLKDVDNIDFAEDLNKVAFTKNYNLYAQEANKKVIQITKDGKNGLKYGTSVHQQEFGIEKGTFFSHDGNLLAFYKMNESMVKEYPIYELQNKPASARYIHYPLAGTENHKVNIGLFNFKNKKTFYLQTNNSEAFSKKEGNENEQYLTNISFSQDDKYISVAILNRAQNNVKWQLYDTKTGKFIRTIFEEKNEKYTEPLNPLLFLDNNIFIFQSQKSGYNSIYLQQINGENEIQLTSNLIVTEIKGLNKNNTKIFFEAIEPNTIDKHVFEIEIASKSIHKISTQSGQNTAILNDTKTAAIIMNTALNKTRTYNLIDLTSYKSIEIFKAPNPLIETNISKPEIIELKAKDGTKLFSRIIKPFDFNENKKYPVIVYVYGGPHAQMITNTWNAGADLWMNALANEGFIIYTLDNRGSGNRGLNFENITFRNLGETEMEDQMQGIAYLKTLPYVDNNRIGVHGWSFGGFMTTSLLTRHPEIFKVGVAGGPVIDWSYYEIMYTERYMDTPEENPIGYAKSSLFNYIDSLKGKLLLIHGTSDNVVLWQHSLLYINKCIKDSKQVDYFVYPEHEHNVLGKDRTHLIRKVAEYFKQNL